MAASKFACAHALHDYKLYSCSVFFILTLLVCLSGGLYKGTEAPQGAAGSAYDAMCSAKRKILAQGTSFCFLFCFVLFCFVLAKKLAFHSLQNSASGCSIHLTNFCVIDGERFDFYLVFSKLNNLLKITVSNNRFRKNKTSSRTN